MRRNIIFIYCLLGLLPGVCSNKINAQNLSDLERNLHLNVKQLSEFVSRFNYETDFKGNKLDSVFKTKIDRKKYLELLFNAEDSRHYSTEYKALKKRFIDTVVSNNFLLDRYSLQIIAEAKARVLYKNKPTEVSVLLNREILNRGVKWVILDVRADFLNVLKTDTVLLRFIPPTSNETDFISLKRVFDDKAFQHYYSHNAYEYNSLSAFLFALNTGIVKYEYVNEIIYHISEIPGWQIRLKNFNRNTTNSGWLIDSIQEIPISD